MICPTCGTHIADGSLRCPACHALVAMTVAMPAVQGRWCPSCGAGVDWEDQVCPHCGLPLETPWESPQAQEELLAPEVPEQGVQPAEETVADADETHEIARIESAIPPEDDPTSRVVRQDEMPRTGRLILASIASAALVGGLALVITHPWNPDQYSIKATTEADTSMAGFPGTVESLSGQDSDADERGEVLTGDEATYDQLMRAYKKLRSYARRADESEELFDTVGYQGTQEERTQARRSVDALAIDISNLIDELGQVDVTSGTYTETRTNLVTLGNWLRNRVEVLQAAWKASAESADPAREHDRLSGLVATGRNDEGVNGYKALFDENYRSYRPRKPRKQ